MKPVLQSLILADKVYEDRLTGKKIVAGIFHRVSFAKHAPVLDSQDRTGNRVQLVPGGFSAGSPSAYISLTEVRGKLPFAVRYVDLKDHAVLLETRMQIECDDPLSTVEVVLPLPPLPTPHAGVFALELLCHDEPIGSLRITVDELPEQSR